MDVQVYVPANMPASITLNAADDGLPQPLRLTIASLPTHGSLALPDGTQINGPASQAASAGRVIYTPDAGFNGDDSFTFRADDGGTAPTGGKSNIAVVTLKVRHMITREYQVITQEDDAYGAESNTTLMSTTLSVGKSSSAMRFRNIDLPRDSEIVSARLKIAMDTIRIDNAVLDWFRAKVHQAGGGNYQTLMNDALRDHMNRQDLEKTLRRVLKDELRRLKIK